VKVTQKKLKKLAAKSKRVGSTVDVKRRVGEYRRKDVVKKTNKVSYAPTVNMKKAENRLLLNCKAKKSCKKNKQTKSNVKKKSGYTYVIQ